MHKPGAPALFLTGIPFVMVCVLAFAQGLPQTPDAEIRAAMAWAFPLNPPSDPNAPKPDMNKPLHVPGSTRSYTLADYDDMFGVPDWFPQDHPPMPNIVAHGSKPAWACAYCHLPTGQGRPENAPLAGLPAAYIVEQVRSFRRGERVTGCPETAKWMPAEARNVTDADLELAAKYFSSLHFKPWTRVIESATVPKTHIAHWMLVPDADGKREPIGDRIIETSIDIAHRAARHSLRLRRLCAVRQHCARRDDCIARCGQGAGVRFVPWTRIAWCRQHPAARGPLAHLHRAPVDPFPVRWACQFRRRADAAGSLAIDAEEHDRVAAYAASRHP